MSIKSELRKEIKSNRSCIENKDSISKAITDLLLSSELYIDSDVILCYCALADEVNTDSIISNALCDNKVIALPYCLDSNGNMDFYIISSFDDLKVGAFGVREPNIDKCKALTNYKNSVIIVPALAFDGNGYRLGYGKGYYDRFLEKHNIISIGLCYDELLQNKIPTDSYDLPVNYIITEKQFIDCVNGGKNGKFE